MNKRILINFLKKNGWVCKKDEVGTTYCLLTLEDRIIQIIPSIGKLGAKQELSFLESVSTQEFTYANNYIFNDENDYDLLIQPWGNQIEFEAEKIKVEDVERTVNQIISWAKEQNISDALDECCRNIPDRPGQRQLNHLVAHALAGNTTVLKEYQDSFSKGDYLNFVPMITSTVIDRSVELAEKTKVS